MSSNLIIVRISIQSDIYLLIKSNDYLPAKYVSKFEDKTLTNQQIEYLYNCLRDGSIKWGHLYCMDYQLENPDLILA